MRISIIGSGNVATHMAAAFTNAGHNIVQVWSRDFKNASLLAYHIKSEAVEEIEQLDKNIDILIIAVKDDAIGDVASQLNLGNTLIVHTSGSMPLSILNGVSANIGVLYPLQTFSREKELKFEDVPVLIEGNSQRIVEKLTELATSVSAHVLELKSEKRLALHVAAVFACNFVNYLYSASKSIVDAEDLNFDLLRPLMLETAHKVQRLNPEEVQTGPAVRDDGVTIQKHLDFLATKPELQFLYRTLSQSIINFYHKP